MSGQLMGAGSPAPAKSNFNINPEDQPMVISSLLKQMRELQDVLDNKAREARNLQYELEKLERERNDTNNALRNVLAPLIEDNAALFLTHEDSVVRGMAKEILSRGSLVKELGMMEKSAKAYSSRGY